MFLPLEVPERLGIPLYKRLKPSYEENPLLSNNFIFVQARTRTEELHLAVKTALSSMPSSRLTDPPAATLKDPPTFIAKWIDYSNKYGFGFQLSDKSIGILFNDNTRISYSSDRR